MDAYKKLTNNKCNKIAAKELKVSETHVGRIANFLVSEYFIIPICPLSNVNLYKRTKRKPNPKIIFDVIKSKKDHDGGSSLVEYQKLQYRCTIKSEITDRVMKYCRLFSPKKTKKYIFPPNDNLKLGYKVIIHDGKYQKCVMIFPDRIHLTVDELSKSDEIIDERIRRIAYTIQHLFKIKLGMPKPVGRDKEYAIVPKENFLIEALEEATFEIDSPEGKVKADKSGDKKLLDGKQIEFNSKDLTMTYLKMIPTVQMIGKIALSNKTTIEDLEIQITDTKTMLSEVRPMLEKIVDFIKKSEEHKKIGLKDNIERGMI